MLKFLLSNINERKLNKYYPLVSQINQLEEQISSLTRKEIEEYSIKLKDDLRTENNDLKYLPLAFALVREVCKRVLNIRLFDVQLLGGILLYNGKIAEMKTGEGKTLVAVLPAYLNALHSKGVHIVTVNDYLAKRDALLLAPVYDYLGLEVGLIQQGMNSEERRLNYNCDITYVTNSELGFDYLRDNMVMTKDDLVQRDFNFAIVDEIDSILIDEARTPLIISEQVNKSLDKYHNANILSQQLIKNIDYEVDKKKLSITLTDKGLKKCEIFLKISDLYDVNNPWAAYIYNALKAKELYQKNINYIVKEDKIVIVDEFTGRIMPDRQWGDGLHQAVEAKENVKISPESQALASITYQNFFLLYPKLSGMTGTAKTDSAEFEKIYNLEVLEVPTNKPLIRIDYPDIIYKTKNAKWKAIVNECLKMYKVGRPVLVGTPDVEKSEILSSLLQLQHIPHNVLNAKPENMLREVEIVAQAGRKYAITIATNMAGRGTDILLGGNVEYLSHSQSLYLIKYFFNKYHVLLDFHKKVQQEYSSTNLLNLEYLIVIALSQISHLIRLEKNFEAIDTQIFNDIISEKSSFSQIKNGIQDLNIAIKNLTKHYIEFEKQEVYDLGGLYIIGTERHESRRIDNQLRGRAGRQGDPGSSRFFLSLEDHLLQIFAQDKITKLTTFFKLDDDLAIESRFLSNTLDSAQQKVEVFNFDIRQRLFDYDETLNKQRKIIYKERRFLLNNDYLRDLVLTYAENTIEDILSNYTEVVDNRSSSNQYIINQIIELLGIVDIFQHNQWTLLNKENLLSFFHEQLYISYDLKEAYLENINAGLPRKIEKYYLLEQIDNLWKNHLKQMEILRESVGWRVYGQQDPILEYQNEALSILIKIHQRMQHAVIISFFRTNIVIT
uniref:Protein translocase subunit SecA n=1 Tax=Bulboplastis apyrenoidosa TaxID=1070855 RepID=A0A1Y9TM58_9RHOD|nr:preprotein translocase subunit secA [Bulboplastis apyrenoidosa]ARO90747.1 preprotein translocase subunit secA [Bulboplastis apyrenoidosa]